MTKLASIARKLGQRLGSQFNVYKSSVYLDGFSSIVSGITLESTPYKNTIYVRRIILPCYFDYRFLITSYSNRIYNQASNTGDMFVGNDADILDAIETAISQSSMIAELRMPYGPAEFLREFRQPDPDHLRHAHSFDLGCAALLCDELIYAARCFHATKQVVRTYGPYGDHDDRLIAACDEWLDLVALDPREAQVLCQARSQDVAAAYGFRHREH